MRILRLLALCALLLPLPAAAQNQPRGQQQQPPQQQQPQQAPQPAPPKPYKPVAVKAPAPVNEPGLEGLRKQLAAAAQKKDRTALARLTVGKGFFWERETGDGADKKKSSIDNLATALGLASKDGVGWDMLAGYAEEPTASPMPGRANTLCAPADPTFDDKAFEALLNDTQTDFSEWGYPVTGDVEVRSAPQANAPVIGKLGSAFVRVLPEAASASPPSLMRIVMPDGKTGYVPVDTLAPIGGDRLCYAKEGNAWKIGGYIGGGDAQ
ncbi:MAG: hypothetical protein ACK4UO_09535 [Pseudolabrys sp.]